MLCGQGDIMACSGKIVHSLDGRPLVACPWLSRAGHDAGAPTGLQDVTAVAASACGRYVLVGHKSADSEGGRSKLLMLSAPSGGVVSELSCGIAGGVASVAFSRDGHFAACLGGDALHRMYLFQSFTGSWGDSVLLCELQVSSANINLIAFLAFEPALLRSAALVRASSKKEAATSKDQQVGKEPTVHEKEEDKTEKAKAKTKTKTTAEEEAENEEERAQPVLYDIATAGDGVIKFWTIRGQNVTQACGEYNNAAGAEQSARITQAVITALSSYVGLEERAGGHAVTGDAEGNIYLWAGAFFLWLVRLLFFCLSLLLLQLFVLLFMCASRRCRQSLQWLKHRHVVRFFLLFFFLVFSLLLLVLVCCCWRGVSVS